MRLKNVLKSVAVTSVMAAAVVGVASPANAAYTNCGRSYACMWQNADYPNSPQAYFGYHMSLGWSGLNNDVSSVVNNGYSGNLSIARFFDGANYDGASIAMYDPSSGRQSRDPNLTNGTNYTTSNWNDRISSGSFTNS
jgi:Peptidase inhibitor family I36